MLVRNVVAGPFEELDKAALPGQICQFTFGVLRAEADFEPGRYDLLHAHYWLSGQVGAVAAERWGVPLVQSMHTLGKVKNLALAGGDCAEPAVRIRGEGEVVAAADRLVANTAEEARQLVELYGADPWRVETVNPGVDLSVFRPGPVRAARPRLGLPAGRGRAGLRRPDPAAEGPRRRAARRGRAAASSSPGLARRLVVVIRGRPERVRGRRARPARRAGGARWASRTVVRLEPPCPQPELADWYRAATWCWCRRTRSRSGWWRSRLRRAARRWSPPRSAGCAPRSGTASPASWWTGTTRWPVRGCWPSWWPRPGGSRSCPAARVEHASGFGWPATADRLIDVYTGAMNEAAVTVRA